MSSAIDPTKPTEGAATTQSVRDNFQAAKDEIEDNQNGITNALAAAAAAQATADAAASAASSAAMTAIQAIYPIGSIYISTLTTNPNTLLGFGTWSTFGAGKVLVSQDTGDGDFDTIEETGGEKTHTLTTAELAVHTHTQNAHTHTQNAHTHTQNSHNHTQDAHSHTNTTYNTDSGSSSLMRAGAGSGTNTWVSQSVTATNQAATAVNQNTTATNQDTTATNNNAGSGSAHNNIQPYIVVKMWKRTA